VDALSRLDGLPADDARAELQRCCGSSRWVGGMLASRPFLDRERLLSAAETVFGSLGPADWREAFDHHPRIGDREALRARFASTRTWAEGEQAGAREAQGDVIDALAEGNRAYEARFGYIFIVCATGKSATEMQGLLRERLSNDAATELRIAAAEQTKITRLRLAKLLDT
jgi:2-oxo-4-hydroxy-4-carboxy-5-ureidoimidazoline decarboxylase